MIRGLLIALLFAFAIAEDGSSDVVVLTDSSIGTSLQKGTWLLEFYAPWCGHCKHLAPIYEELATNLKGKVSVAKIDCTVEKESANAFGIRGYPTIKLVKDGKVYEYEGERKIESFVKFTEEGYSTQPSVSLPESLAGQAASGGAAGTADVKILTDSNFEKLTKEGSWLLEFYAPWCGHCKKLAPIYEQVATALKGKVNVGKVDCTEQTGLARRFGIRGYPTIKFLKNGQVYEYKGDRSQDDFVKFVTEGYTKMEFSPLPSAISGGDNFMDEIGQVFKGLEKTLREKVWIAIAGIFVLGVLVGKFLFSSTKYIHVQPATASQSAVPKEQKHE